MAQKPRLEFHALTPDRWGDFEKLFGPRGAYGGCWCMYWRLSRSEFAKGQGAGNRRAMKRIVDSGRIPGIIAYAVGEPVGWCSVAPREDFPSLERSRVLKRLDDQPVWSIVCFYIARDYRQRGVAEGLIRAAVRYVNKQGGKIVEAYPTTPRGRVLAPVSSYMGVPVMFERLGFQECARPSPARVIMRYYIGRKPCPR
jgi:GNAT superfamily N-acetyltransferase